MCQNAHSWKEINPLAIYCWVLRKIFVKDDGTEKFHLIESALYNLILVPMFISIVLIINRFFCC